MANAASPEFGVKSSIQWQFAYGPQPSPPPTGEPPAPSGGGEEPTPSPKRTTLVALGDSYSSGEGAGDYDADPLRCHRSADAWPRLLAKLTPKIEEVTLLACSGAESSALVG